MEYDIGSNESASSAVVRAVSAVEGREPCFLRRTFRVTVDNGEYLTLLSLEFRLHQSSGQDPTCSSVG